MKESNRLYLRNKSIMTELAGYIITIIVGITLGLIGGGGSIFIIPVLVYLFKIPAFEATSYSHFIVGVTAMIASVGYVMDRKVHFPSVLYFGLPAMLSVYLVRAYFLPLLPNSIQIGRYDVSENTLILFLFAIMMITASYSMIKKCENCDKESDSNSIKLNLPLIILSGAFIGMLTGIVGAGGGFLIIPALVFFARLPMKKAISTSLFIIAMKSMVGFSSEIGTIQFNWIFLFLISTLSVLGMFIGMYLNKSINGDKLKPIFGWFILSMGVLIFSLELHALLV